MEKDRNEPTLTTFENAQAYCAWLSRQEGQSYVLPTLAQLSAAIESGQITMPVPEWTSERYIFNPATGSVDENPAREALAGFRIVTRSSE